MLYNTNVLKGFILEINKDGTAKVIDSTEQVHSRVFILNSSNTAVKPLVTKTSQVVLLQLMGNASVIFGIPYDNITQQKKLSVDNQGDYKIGNLKTGDNIYFTESGIKINSLNNKISIKNNSTNLKIILDTLIDTVVAIKVRDPLTGLYTLEVDPIIITQLNNIKAAIQDLLDT